MKFIHFLTVINQIKNTKFDFHGNIGSLVAFNSTKEFYWQILIEQKFNKKENYTYAIISFQLRIIDNELHFDKKEISFNVIEKYFDYAKEEFLHQISNYRIKGVSVF